MIKLISASNLPYAFKDSLLSALIHFTYHNWMINEGYSNQYNVKFRDEEWVKIYTLMHIAVGDVLFMNKCEDYLAYRDELLNAFEKYFLKRSTLTEKDKLVFKHFSKWLCAGTRFTEQIVLERVHISQFGHGLKERGIWREEYAYSQAPVVI